MQGEKRSERNLIHSSSVFTNCISNAAASFFNPAKACTSQQGSFPPWALHCSLLFYNATKNTWLDFHSVLRRRKTQRKRKDCLFFLYSNLQIIIVCKKNQSLNMSAENISPLEWYEFKKQGLVGVLNFSGCYYCVSNCLVLCNLPAELEIPFFFVLFFVRVCVHMRYQQ